MTPLIKCVTLKKIAENMSMVLRRNDEERKGGKEGRNYSEERNETNDSMNESCSGKKGVAGAKDFGSESQMYCVFKRFKATGRWGTGVGVHLSCLKRGNYVRMLDISGYLI